MIQWGWPESVDRFLAVWFAEESSVDARLLETVRRLRASGVRCYVATVQERYRTAYLRQEMGFAHLFDYLFASAKVGAVKPQRQFYAAVTQAIALPPARILFGDDALADHFDLPILLDRHRALPDVRLTCQLLLRLLDLWQAQHKDQRVHLLRRVAGVNTEPEPTQLALF